MEERADAGLAANEVGLMGQAARGAAARVTGVADTAAGATARAVVAQEMAAA